MIAIQNAHALGPSPTVARMRMKTQRRSLVVAMTKMMFASRHSSVQHRSLDLLLLGFLDLVLLRLPVLGCP